MITQEYLKSRLNYNPDTGLFTWKEIPITKQFTAGWNTRWSGKVAGSFTGKGYRQINLDHRQYYASHLAWLWMTGKPPKETIDHINHNPADDRFVNLRSVTQHDNCKNQKIPKNNTSGVVGVYLIKTSRKWMSRIRHNGTLIQLGTYSNKMDAITARQKAEKKYGFHRNHGNANTIKRIST